SLGRGCIRFNVASCWRRARFSRRSPRRVRNSRSIAPTRSPMAWIMGGCYRIPLWTATLYPVEITGGQNFGEAQEAILYCFDLLWHDGEDLRSLPLLERKRRLQR